MICMFGEVLKYVHWHDEEDEDLLISSSYYLSSSSEEKLDLLKVWGETVGRARKMDDLPMWLQYYPKTLFDTINRRQ